MADRDDTWWAMVRVTLHKGISHQICEGVHIRRIPIEECSKTSGVAVESIRRLIDQFQKQARLHEDDDPSELQLFIERTCKQNPDTGEIEWVSCEYVESSALPLRLPVPPHKPGFSASSRMISMVPGWPLEHDCHERCYRTRSHEF